MKALNPPLGDPVLKATLHQAWNEVFGQTNPLVGHQLSAEEWAASLEYPEMDLVSVKKISKLLDISEKTIWDWLYRNRKQPKMDPLPYYRLGGLVRFSVKEVMAWVQRRRVRIVPIGKNWQ